MLSHLSDGFLSSSCMLRVSAAEALSTRIEPQKIQPNWCWSSECWLHARQTIELPWIPGKQTR